MEREERETDVMLQEDMAMKMHVLWQNIATEDAERAIRQERDTANTETEADSQRIQRIRARKVMKRGAVKVEHRVKQWV